MSDSLRQHKKLISEAVLTALFYVKAPTILATDASDVGIGAALSQVQHGKEVPITFWSRTLKSSERNYDINEAEALASVEGCETFEKYLLGRPFTLRTDHSVLQALLQRYSTNRKSKKFHRWYERLTEFNYTVKYCKGSDNVLADFLSRLPCPASITAQSESPHIHAV